jgi:hypothetical protein
VGLDSPERARLEMLRSGATISAMADPRTESMIGCAAAMCVELGDIGGSDRAAYHRDWHRLHRPRSSVQDALGALDPARASDILPENHCWRCGLRGEHNTALACIDALRDRLAELGDSGDGRRGGRPRKTAAAGNGTRYTCEQSDAKARSSTPPVAAVSPTKPACAAGDAGDTLRLVSRGTEAGLNVRSGVLSRWAGRTAPSC